MVNNEILEGLKTAIERKYTLQQAMMSFFNAGYKKEEIEEAARLLYTNYPQIAKPQAKPEAQKNPSSAPTHEKPTQRPLPAQGQAQISQKPVGIKSKQEISKYEEKTKPKRKILIILLIVLLIVIVGLSIGFFIFKDEVIQFFKNLF